jgi:hypothetical protein
MVGSWGGYPLDYDFDGRIDELRLTKGVARDISSVPTAPFLWPTGGGPFFGRVSLLLPLNGSSGGTAFPDASSYALSVSGVGNAQTSTAQSKWGGSSLLLDGTGDYLSVPDNNVLDFGTGDFTIECWARFTSLVNVPFIFYKGDSSTSNPGWFGEVGPSNAYFGYQTNGSQFYAAFTTTLTTGAWHHLAFCRVGNRLYVGINGVVQSAIVSGAEGSKDNSNAFLIGSFAPVNNLYDLNGHIQDFRVTKGAALYVNSYTPPTAAFPTS